MLAGGLAASPHMISATVTAISRVVFEYKGEVPGWRHKYEIDIWHIDVLGTKIHSEIFITLLVFVTSNNREIVKSVLGYIKLAIHTLPVELIKPHLKELVPALLTWSHDHKNHFKAKVRHVFERMIRRFGWEEVYACAQGEDASKVLVNIKKRKDRAKRKKQAKAHGNEDGDEEEVNHSIIHCFVYTLLRPSQPTINARSGDAFDDVLYGSESEGEDSDGEDMQPINTKKGGKDFGPRLRVDGEEPMDLLQGASSRIISSCIYLVLNLQILIMYLASTNQRRRKPGQDASHFKTDEDTGKMIIDEDENSEEAGNNPAANEAGAAYKELLTSADGYIKGPNGRIKFHRDTKKRRREAEDDGDVEMGDSTPLARTKKTNPATRARIGQEFKAKVRYLPDTNSPTKNSCRKPVVTLERVE
jgi:ribosomal RNA-processing protein 12